MSPVAVATPCDGTAGSKRPAPPPSVCLLACYLPGPLPASAPLASPVGSRQLESAPQTASQLLLQPCRVDTSATGPRADNHPIGFVEAGQHSSGDVPEPPRYLMTLDRRTHWFRDDQTNPGTGPVVVSSPDVDDDIALHRTYPVLHRLVELRRPPHAVACGKHRQKACRSDQAVNSRRPLRRRPDTMARPALVRIRKRKPCTRARRRLFGWKVRLPLATAFSSFCLAVCLAVLRPLTIRKRVGPRVGRS